MKADGTTHQVAAGHWVCLLGNAPHTLRGAEDPLVLLTVMFH